MLMPLHATVIWANHGYVACQTEGNSDIVEPDLLAQ